MYYNIIFTIIDDVTTHNCIIKASDKHKALNNFYEWAKSNNIIIMQSEIISLDINEYGIVYQDVLFN